MQIYQPFPNAQPAQFGYQNFYTQPEPLNVHLIAQAKKIAYETLQKQLNQLQPQPVVRRRQVNRQVVQLDQLNLNLTAQAQQFAYNALKIQPQQLNPPFPVQPRQLRSPIQQVQPQGRVLPSPQIQPDQLNLQLGHQTGQFMLPSPDVQPLLQRTERFVKRGPRGEELYVINEGHVTYYLKKGLSPEAVYNYNLAHMIGVGPPVEIISADSVKMEEGVCLRQALKEKLITVEEARKQIQYLHKVLFDSGIAHCDVKFENCLYFPKHKKVLLIDNGDLTIYGQQRRIKTDGANETVLISPYGHQDGKVGPATDLKGFLHILLHAVHE